MFDYKQRPPDNRKEFERRWVEIFGKPDPLNCECINWAGVWDVDELKSNVYGHHPRCEHAETTEQKQPSLKD